MSNDKLSARESNAPNSTDVWQEVTGQDLGTSGAFPGDKRGLDVITYPNVMFTIEDQPNANTKFICYTFENGTSSTIPDETDPIWRVCRTVTSGTKTFTQYANDGKFDQICANREALFPDAPFANTISVQLNGTNSYIDVPDSADLEFSRLEAFSLGIWFKSTDSGAQNYMEKMNANQGWRFHITGQRMTLEFRGVGTGDRIRVRSDVNNTVLADGSWHFVTTTYDGSGAAAGVALYIDGAAIALDIQNDTLTGDPAAGDTLSLGARSGGGSNFNGNMDEGSVWNAELTAAEVTEVYNSGTAINLASGSGGISSGLVSWWRFESDTISNIADSEGTNDGTFINGVSGDFETETPP